VCKIADLLIPCWAEFVASFIDKTKIRRTPEADYLEEGLQQVAQQGLNSVNQEQNNKEWLQQSMAALPKEDLEKLVLMSPVDALKPALSKENLTTLIEKADPVIVFRLLQDAGQDLIAECLAGQDEQSQLLAKAIFHLPAEYLAKILPLCQLSILARLSQQSDAFKTIPSLAPALASSAIRLANQAEFIPLLKLEDRQRLAAAMSFDRARDLGLHFQKLSRQRLALWIDSLSVDQVKAMTPVLSEESLKILPSLIAPSQFEALANGVSSKQKDNLLTKAQRYVKDYSQEKRAIEALSHPLTLALFFLHGHRAEAMEMLVLLKKAAAPAFTFLTPQEIPYYLPYLTNEAAEEGVHYLKEGNLETFLTYLTPEKVKACAKKLHAEKKVSQALPLLKGEKLNALFEGLPPIEAVSYVRELKTPEQHSAVWHFDPQMEDQMLQWHFHEGNLPLFRLAVVAYLPHLCKLVEKLLPLFSNEQLHAFFSQADARQMCSSLRQLAHDKQRVDVVFNYVKEKWWEHICKQMWKEICEKINATKAESQQDLLNLQKSFDTFNENLDRFIKETEKEPNQPLLQQKLQQLNTVYGELQKETDRLWAHFSDIFKDLSFFAELIEKLPPDKKNLFTVSLKKCQEAYARTTLKTKNIREALVAALDQPNSLRAKLRAAEKKVALPLPSPLPLRKGSSKEIAQAYETLRNALERIGITGDVLDELDLSYEDCFKKGINDSKTLKEKGITHRESFEQYMKALIK
jgi:hypothetical protein